jgi:hypothetical protein
MTEHKLEFQDERTKQEWLCWWEHWGQAQFQEFFRFIRRAKRVKSTEVGPRRSDVVRHSGSSSVPVVLGGDSEVKHPDIE